MGTSYNPSENGYLYVKMNGRQVYKYALNNMPKLITECLKKNKVRLEDVSKIFIHQANEKMIIAIAEKLYAEHGISKVPISALPLTVQFLGNTSVATIPTLLDLLWKDKLPNHQFGNNEYWVFASVGAGMHTNCILYKTN